MSGHKVCGIYKISSPSGNFYIGSSIDVPRRWDQHVKCMARGKHHNKALQAAFSKYGPDELRFELIAEVDAGRLRDAEQLAINCLSPTYNSTTVVGCPLDELWKRPEFIASQREVGRRSMAALRSDPVVYARMMEAVSVSSSARWKEPEFRARMKASAQGKCKPVRCVETGVVFSGITEVSKWLGSSIAGVSLAVSEGRKFHGYSWQRASADQRADFVRSGRPILNPTGCEEYLASLKAAKAVRVARPVTRVCVGDSFESMVDAARSLGLPESAAVGIGMVASGKRKTAYGFRWAYSETVS